MQRYHAANEIRDETNREMETLGFEWRRKTKVTNRARESIPSHPSEPVLLTRTRRRRGHPLLLLDLHSTPARPPAAGERAEAGRPYGRGRGSGSGWECGRRDGRGRAVDGGVDSGEAG